MVTRRYMGFRREELGEIYEMLRFLSKRIIRRGN